MADRRRRFPVTYADWSWREAGAIARALCTARVSRGPSQARLLERLQALYGPSDVHLLNYAHHGLAMALALFRQQHPDRCEVIVPAYICPSVPQTVREAGLRLRAVPVAQDLNLTVEGVRAAINPGTLAVIAPHMYACPAPIEAIEALCRETGVFLLDDAAQVVGERTGGRLLGTFGDVGIISFAQSKAIVTGIRGSGGVLLVNRPEWKPALAASVAALPPAAHRAGALADFLWNHVWHTWTGSSGYYAGRLLERLGMARRPAAGPTQISNLEAAVALVQLDRWDRLRQQRLRVLDAYQEALSRVPGVVFPQYAPGRYLARVVVCLPPQTSGPAVRSALLERGVEARAPYPPWAESPLDGDALHGGGRLLGLPTHPAWGPKDMAAICEALHEVLGAATGDAS